MPSVLIELNSDDAMAGFRPDQVRELDPELMKGFLITIAWKLSLQRRWVVFKP